jgi:hypothetical protein
MPLSGNSLKEPDGARLPTDEPSLPRRQARDVAIRQESVPTMMDASLWMSSVYELVKAYGLWVLFIGIALESLGIPVPGETGWYRPRSLPDRRSD